MPYFQMGIVRPLLAFAALAVVSAACTSSSTEPAKTEDDLGEPARVPNPPPKYPRSGQTGALADGGEGGDLQIKCGGYKPYVCPMDDGTFKCSERPCVPDCSRVGCIGGEVCQKCDGGFVCLAPGSSC